jgi:hypothetical protein
MDTSMPRAAAVDARMNGGYAQSRVPFVAIMVNLRSAMVLSSFKCNVIRQSSD